MNDLISRKEAIKMFLDEGMPTAAVYIERMPSAMLETYEERTETHARDLINRQDAIDLLMTRLIETANNNIGIKCDAGQVFEDASKRVRYWINDLPSAQMELPVQPEKKSLTFSERQKIIREYKDWRIFNNAADCAESFLAYLCIKGYIDG